ncbi:MAG: PQQ-binding-like beta-propeller repeat protein [Candidatus Methanomethylophilaceae archaeon]
MKAVKAVAVVLILLSVTSIVPGAEADSGTDYMLLLDNGDGSYAWYTVVPGSTLLDTVKGTLEANGITVSVDAGSITSIDGRSETVTGTVVCSWRFYIWDYYCWTYGGTDGDVKYDSGDLCIGFRSSSSSLPVATPVFRDVWISIRGDSSCTGISASYMPDSVATPLEWYIESEAGAVCGSILAADGLVYYVTSGDYYGTGVNRDPHLYCVDTVNGEVVWYLSYSIDHSHGSSQYELNAPLIVDDMIIVTSANRHIYCIDRMDGSVLHEMVPKGDAAHFTGVFNTQEYEYLPIMDEEWTIQGITSTNGPSSAIYDSGAIYFTTHDGRVRCYSVDRINGFTEIWTYTPDREDRGCFYCSTPLITYVDGTRVLVCGGYSGRLYCVNASTGEEISVTYVAELAGHSQGVVSRVVDAGDGTVIVSCDDGGMTPRNGSLSRYDLRDTSSPMWRLDIYGGSAIAVDGTLYGYLRPALSSYDGSGKAQVFDKNGTLSDADSGYYALSIADGHVIWCVPNAASCKSSMTYCGGRIYCVDYSPLSVWPNGGALRCLDPDTGDVIWRMRLEPGSSDAYNMCSPTVVDGKVYVGNDDGTIYCISEIPGSPVSVTSDIDYRSQGLAHWSWAALFSAMGLTLLVAVLMYRRG